MVKEAISSDGYKMTIAESPESLFKMLSLKFIQSKFIQYQDNNYFIKEKPNKFFFAIAPKTSMLITENTLLIWNKMWPIV